MRKMQAEGHSLPAISGAMKAQGFVLSHVAIRRALARLSSAPPAAAAAIPAPAETISVAPLLHNAYRPPGR